MCIILLLPAEVIQAGDEALYSKLHHLINAIWNKEEFCQ